MFAEANLRILGTTTTHSLSQLNDALTKLNKNYDNATIDLGDFVSEVADVLVQSKNSSNNNFNSFDKSINIYPNPAVNQFNLTFNSNNDQVATIIRICLNNNLYF